MSARDEILGSLRASLERGDLPFPPPDAKALTSKERMTVTDAPAMSMDLGARFGAELEALHGTFDVVDSASSARMACVNRIMSWLDEEKDERKGMVLETGQEMSVLSWSEEQLGLPGIERALNDVGLELITPKSVATTEERDAIRMIRIGITGVEAAFASTGSMLMAASESGTNRVASLLPFRHLALIPLSKLYPTGEDWMRELREFGDFTKWIRSHANLSLITGPSKSADIEGNLTLGVHGPKFVHAVLFDDIRGGDRSRSWDKDSDKDGDRSSPWDKSDDDDRLRPLETLDSGNDDDRSSLWEKGDADDASSLWKKSDDSDTSNPWDSDLFKDF